MTEIVEAVQHDASATSAVLVNLHAKLMLEDAGLDELRAALEDEAQCEWYVVDLDHDRIEPVDAPRASARMGVMLRRRPAGMAAWKPFLNDLGVPINTTTAADTESVLVFVRASTRSGSTRTLLWCFGTASLAVPNELTDGRFGLIVALNKHAGADSIDSWRVLPDTARRRRTAGDPISRVRQLQAEVRDGYRHTLTAKSPSASPVQGLGFDTVSDLLRGLRVITQDELMADLEGGRGLRFATYLERWSDFAVLADYLLEIRMRADYRAEWDWIDHVVPVAPRAEVERLLDVLYQQMVSDNNATIDLVLPDFEEDGDTTARRLFFGMGSEQAISYPVKWEHVRRRLVGAAPAVRHPLRRKIKLRPEDAPHSATRQFPLTDLLVAEFHDDGRRYLLGDGELLVVDVDFLARLDAAIDNIPWSDFPFPLYQGGTERAYLESATEKGAHLALLDQRNIYLPNQSPFEPCDLLTDDGRLVFAKLKGRSSTFSHLCAQAESAAEMFLRHPAARDQLLDRVAEAGSTTEIETAATTAMAALEDRRPNTVVVTLLLLGTWRKIDLKTLPLVSRLRLRRTFDRITDLGYRFEVASPRLIPTQQARR
jgi:uncharacterized protein (TIGR04141 family)